MEYIHNLSDSGLQPICTWAQNCPVHLVLCLMHHEEMFVVFSDKKDSVINNRCWTLRSVKDQKSKKFWNTLILKYQLPYKKKNLFGVSLW